MSGILIVSINPHDSTIIPVMGELVNESWGPDYVGVVDPVGFLRRAQYAACAYAQGDALKDLDGVKGTVCITRYHGCPDDYADTRPYLGALTAKKDLPWRQRLQIVRALHNRAVQLVRISPETYGKELYATTDNWFMVVVLHALGLFSSKPRWWHYVRCGETEIKSRFKLWKLNI